MSEVKLYLGDCLEILPTLADNSVDAVITDPPYSSGARTSADKPGRKGMSRKAKWNAQVMTNDRMTTVGFVWMMRNIGRQSGRVLKDGGSLLSFIDWRQYPILYAALETVNLRIQTMVVWDKINMALGNGFRNQHELIIHAANGVPNINNRGTPNVLSITRISSSDLHPTEKPVSLMAKLIEVVTRDDDTILDPFMGSGTTGVACVQMDRNFIGIEIEPKYYEIAETRIKEAQMQLRMPF